MKSQLLSTEHLKILMEDLTNGIILNNKLVSATGNFSNNKFISTDGIIANNESVSTDKIITENEIISVNEIRNERGSTMVEAAVIFPLVILTVTAVVCMLVFFTRQVYVQSEMHMSLRAAAYEEMGTVDSLIERKNSFSICETGKGNRKIMFCKGHISMNGSGLLDGKFQKKIEGRVYASREIDFVRKQDLVNNGVFQ